MSKHYILLEENALYHDTWILLKKYRDVVWSLELSVQKARRIFNVEFGKSIEEFLDSIYLAGIDFKENGLEEHAKCIERSYQMLKTVNAAVDLLRTKHKHGEEYYWILYYSFLSPQKYRNTEEIVELLRPHITLLNFSTINKRTNPQGFVLFCFRQELQLAIADNRYNKSLKRFNQT